MASRLPSLRGIETFVCVAEVLNLRVASERLNVTISAISHRIQALEEELGIQLFDRSGRHLRLTKEGVAYLDQLRPGLAFLQEATMSARKALARPLLRISAPPIFHDQGLLPRLREFLADRADIRIELLSSGRRRSAGSDVSIVPLSSSTIREGARPLIEILVTPVCSPGFLARHPMRTPADLLTLPLLDTLPSLKGWQTWFAAAELDEEPPAPALSFDNHVLLHHATTEGLGVALGSDVLTGELVRRGALVQPFPIACLMPPSIGVLVNERSNTRLAKPFADWLVASFAKPVQISSTDLAESAA